jgi:ATP-dependent helicase/DNAse subunit B
MIVTYIRSSSYNNYDYCQMQYFITYVLGHRSTSGKKAQLGTIVHKVMEVLSSCKKKLQGNEEKKSLYIKDDAIGKVNFTPRSLFTKKFVSKILDRSYEHYTSTCTHKYTGADIKFCRTQTETGLTYNDGQFDPRKREIVDAEPQFDIAIDEPWAKFKYKMPSGEEVEGQLAIKGTIDLVTKVADDTIEVIDWKTGRRLNWATGEEKTYEKLLEDPQLLLYNYAISKLYPDYNEAIMTIFYIRDGGPFSMCFDESDRKKFLQMLKTRVKQIQRNNFPQPCSRNRSHFKCTKLCHFYKNNWPGTNISMCEHVEEHLKAFGEAETVEKCTREGFNVGYYEAPG